MGLPFLFRREAILFLADDRPARCGSSYGVVGL